MKQQYAWIFWAGLAVTFVIGAGLSIYLYEATLRPPEPRVQAVLAESLDEQFNPVGPVSSFSPGDTFYISVRTQFIPAHSIVTVNWFYSNRLIHAQDQVTGAVGEVYVLGFELQRIDAVWPTGDYRVDVLLNGEIVGAASFSVVA